MLKKIGLLIFLVLLIPAGLEAAEPIRIAAIGELQDHATARLVHLRYFQALRFASEQVNARGGVLGRPVELIFLDNGGTPLGSRDAAVQALEAGVSAVLGGLLSSHAMGMAPVLQAAGMPLLTVGATNPAVTEVGAYIFRICYTDEFQGALLARLVGEELRKGTAAVVFQSGDTYSMGLAEIFTHHYRRSGGQVVYEGAYLKSASDFTDIVEQLMALAPDAVVVPGYAREAALLIRQARNRGVAAVFAGADGWGDQMLDYGGEAVEGSYRIDHWHQDVSHPGSRAFVEAFIHSPYQDGPTIYSASALAYDAFNLLIDAMGRAGSAEPAAIRDALAATRDFQGITGNIRFDARRNPVKPAVLLRFGKRDIDYLGDIGF
jgi:branched-chain amino acid transport system substrate-binding protein